MNFSPLTEYLDHLAQEEKMPCAGCIITKDGNVVYSYFPGYTDFDTKQKSSESQLLNIFSASKVVTCTAAMRLFERGKFLLSDPVYEYIPAFKEMYIKKYLENGKTEIIKASKPIRIVDLFTMCAGLTYEFSENMRQVVADTNGRAPTMDIINAISKDTLVFEPGEHWNYSLCHDVIAGLVEVISGTRFSDYVKTNIFDPLEMTSSTYRRNDEIYSKIAPLYDRYPSTGEIYKKSDNSCSFIFGSEYDSGGAGMASTAEDYIKFITAMCYMGKAPGKDRIIGSRTVNLMRENRLTEKQIKDSWITDGYGYGLGVRMRMNDPIAMSVSPVGDFGWDGAAGAFVHIDPENRVGLFYTQHLLSNSNTPIHHRLRQLLYTCIED